MQAFFYYLLLPFIYLVALLPFPILYLLSDVLCFLLYYVAGYRKKVVMNNLRNSFPDKKPGEIRKITRRYYRYLADLLLESFRTLTVSPRKALARCRVTNIEVLQDATRYSHAIAVMGHTGNWEWACSTLGLLDLFEPQVVYKPLSNPYFDRLLIRMRSRFGCRLVPMNQTLRAFLPKGERTKLLNLVADQTPSSSESLWMPLLGQETRVYTGPEKLAGRLNCPVYYVSMKKPRRGYYELTIELLAEKPAELPEYELTQRFIRRLEEDIRNTPHLWLWSHRRWKHKRIAKG